MSFLALEVIITLVEQPISKGHNPFSFLTVIPNPNEEAATHNGRAYYAELRQPRHDGGCLTTAATTTTWMPHTIAVLCH